MNTILYKGFSDEKNDWVYGYPFVQKGKGEHCNEETSYIVDNDSEMTKVRSLHQYIGMDDLSSTKIFENDFVWCKDFVGDTVIGEIVYVDYLSQFKIKDNAGYCFELEKMSEIKVIDKLQMNMTIVKDLLGRLLHDTYVEVDIELNGKRMTFISILRGIAKLNDTPDITYIVDTKKYDMNGDEISLGTAKYSILSVKPILYSKPHLFSGVYEKGKEVIPIREYAKTITTNNWVNTDDYTIDDEKLPITLKLNEGNQGQYDVVEVNENDEENIVDLSSYCTQYHIASNGNPYYRDVDDLDFDPYRFFK